MRWIMYLGLIGAVLASVYLNHSTNLLSGSDAPAWDTIGYSLAID